MIGILRQRRELPAVVAGVYLLLLLAGLAVPGDDPLARAGALLTFFLVPGWLAVRLAAGGGGGGWPAPVEVALGLVLSPALAVLALYLVCDLGGASVGAGAAVCQVVGAGLAVKALGMSLLGRGEGRSGAGTGGGGNPGFGWPFWAGLAFLLLLLVPLLAPRIQLSHHGLYHGALVEQILAGRIPPGSPSFLGAETSTYWHFHLFLAAVVQGGGVTSLVASSILRVGALLASFVLAGVLAQRVRPELNPWGLALFALFSVNLARPVLVVLEGVLGGGGGGLGPLIQGGYDAPGVTSALVMGDVRTADGLSKYLNFTSFGWALAAWIGGLTLATEAGRPGWRRGVLFFVLAAGAVSFHFPSSPAVLGVVPAVLYLAPVLAGDAPGWWAPGRGLRAVAPFVLAVGLTAPYWLGLLSIPGAPGGGPAEMLAPSVAYLVHNLRTVLGAYWPLLPLLVAVPGLLRRGSPPVVAMVLAGGACLALGLGLRVPGGNQYKFVLMAAVPTALLGAAGLRVLLVHGATARRALQWTGLALAVTGAALTGLDYVRSGWWSDTGYRSVGRTVVYEPTGAYAFLMTGTPADAVVLEAPVPVDRSNVGTAGGRRSWFLPTPWGFGRWVPGYDQRRETVEAVLGGREPDLEALDGVADETEPPLFVLLDRGVLGEGFGPLLRALEAGGGACLLYRDEGGAVLGVREAC